MHLGAVPRPTTRRSTGPSTRRRSHRPATRPGAAGAAGSPARAHVPRGDVQVAQDTEHDIRLAVLHSSILPPWSRARSGPVCASRFRRSGLARPVPSGPARPVDLCSLRARRSRWRGGNRSLRLSRKPTRQHRGVGRSDAGEGRCERHGIRHLRGRPDDCTHLGGGAQQRTRRGRQAARDVVRHVDWHHGDAGQQGATVTGAHVGIPRCGEHQSLCRCGPFGAAARRQCYDPAPMNPPTMSATSAMSTIRGVR